MDYRRRWLLMSESLTEEFGYTLGLIAGEGSFFIEFSVDSRYSHGVWCGPKFSMTMGAFAREMLEEQCAMYGLGTVNEHTQNPSFSWVLSSREDCHALKHLIDEYLERYEKPGFVSSPKYRAYQQWCEALEMLQPGKRLTASEVIKVAEIRDGINRVEAQTRLSLDQIKEVVEQNSR